MAQQLLMSLKIMLLGLGTVFLALVLLIATIKIINVVLNGPSKKDDKLPKDGNVDLKHIEKIEANEITTESGDQIPYGEMDDEEFIAVITAAVAASLSRSTHDILVKSVRRIPSHSPAWSSISRKDQIATRF